MSRYLTRGMVVLADNHPGTEVALVTARDYAPRAVVVAPADHPDVPEAQMVRPRAGVSIDAAFRCAADDQIPWIAMRRDYTEPRVVLSQVLEATGRRTSRDLPGFVVLFTGSQPRPIRRILTIIDKADGQPSGLLVLAAVAAAQVTGADLDVLLMGAAGEAVSTPKDVREAIHVTRDKDLYEQGVRRATESGIRVNWIAAEDVADKRALVLEQIGEGDYDLVVEDLGSVSLGGRLGRGGRIARAVAADGPAQIVRAILEETDVPLALVLDGVRLGLVPPAVIKGGAGTVLALGIIASGAPAAVASPSELAAQQTSVSQRARTYGAALEEAASLASAAAVEAALATTVDDVATDEAESATAEAPAEATDSDAEAAPDLNDVAPAELAPEDVAPEAAPEVDSDDVKVDSDASSSDVAKAEKAADKAAEEVKDAEKDFDKAQDAAIEATEEVAEAAAAADEAAAAGASAVQAYDEVTALAKDVVADATGVTGALPGGATEEDLAAAEAAQAQALADLEAAGQTADAALAEYQAAAVDAATAEADLEAKAATVTAADADYQKADATAHATDAAHKEAVADSRITPVKGGTIGTHYGEAGSHWSTGYHTGVDFAAPEGTDVMAAASGTVVEVGWDGAYGNRIVIEHENGYHTTYNHLSDTDVSVGQEVTAGDHIGDVGNTGNSFGAHLHFEVTQGGDGWGSGSFEDPEDWLAGEIG